MPTAEKSSSPSSLFRTEVFSTKPAKTTCLSHTHNIFKIFSKHNSFTHSRGESLSWHRQSHEVHVYIRRIKREKLNLEIFYPSRVVVVGVLNICRKSIHRHAGMKKLLNLTSQNYKPKIVFDVKYSTVLSELKSVEQEISTEHSNLQFFSFFANRKWKIWKEEKN